MIAARDADPEIRGPLAALRSSVRNLLCRAAPTLGMLIAAAYVYIWREPTVVLAPTLWADDGTAFLKAAFEQGPSAILQPYGGQICLFQRLVAQVAVLLPISLQPAIYASVAVAAAVLSCSIVLSKRWRFQVPLGARFVCLLALLCSPAVDEAFGNVSNSHWWLAIGLVLLGMLSDPHGRRLRAAELTFTVVTALSGFAAIYAIPTLSVRAIRNRSRHSLAILGIAGAGVLVQVVCVLNSTRIAHGAGLFADPTRDFLVLLRRIFVDSVVGDANLNMVWPRLMPDTWVWLIPIGLIAALIAVWAWAPKAEVGALGLALVAGWLLAIWAVADQPTVLWQLTIVGRYFVVPMAMLYIWLVVSWPNGMLRRGIAGLACVLLATGILSDYHLNSLAPVDWTDFSACVDRRAATCTTELPPGVQLQINPPGR